MFFDTLGIKWWYEPEGFELQFDYDEFEALWDMGEEELREVGVPQTFKHLDGKTYKYLPDFFLPELNYWIEVKGPNPTKEELEKACMLHEMVMDAGRKRIHTAITEKEHESAWEDFSNLGVYIFYGDLPWPYPEKGNIFGYGARHSSGSGFLNFPYPFDEEAQSKKTEYRSLLMGQLRLCWQECPLCSKIGVGEIDAPYCRLCYDRIAERIFTCLVEDYGTASEKDYSRIAELLEDPAVKNAHVAGGPVPLPFLAALEDYLSGQPEAYAVTKSLMNDEFFTVGHKAAKLQKAYEAARSARFEHGESRH